MKNREKKAQTSTAYGKPLDTPIQFDVKWSTFETTEELVAAGETLSIEAQRKAVNAKRLAKAVAAAKTAALTAAGYEKPNIENDEQEQLKAIYRVFIAKKFSPEAARAKAAETLGIEWDDDSDDDE